MLTEDLPAIYLAGWRGRVLVMQPGTSDVRRASHVERYVAEHLARRGMHVMRCEGMPFWALFNVTMTGLHLPGLSHLLDRLHPGAPLASALPLDYCSTRNGISDGDFVAQHYGGALGEDWRARAAAQPLEAARRRAYLEGPDPVPLNCYLENLPRGRELHRLIDATWGGPAALDASLYAEVPIGKVHLLVDVLSSEQLVAVLSWLAGRYWERRAGWPDLLAWAGSAQPEAGRFEVVSGSAKFVEVKSDRDQPSADQRRLYAANESLLRLPMRIIRVRRHETRPMPRPDELGLGCTYPSNRLPGQLPMPDFWEASNSSVQPS